MISTSDKIKVNYCHPQTFVEDQVRQVVECITKSGRKIGISIDHGADGNCVVTIEKMRLIPDDLAWLDGLI